jgi:FtsP/CotA-like multicopper oxidase with cupredoxin domain
MSTHADDHPLAPSPRWGRRTHRLLVGLGLGTLAWGALRVQNDHPPALQRQHIAVRPSGSDAVSTDLASKFEGAYPSTMPPTRSETKYVLRAAPAKIDLLAQGRLTGVWAYNGQVPGPVLHVRVGDRLRVSLANELPQPTTIHWHGVRVDNAMDGVPDVTQRRVEAGGSFEYAFVARDPGTFWYHPHVRANEQVERGLQGVLIVDDDHPPAWSRDVVWVLDDWRVDGAGEIDPQFNGMHDVMHDGRWGNVVTVNGHVHEELSVRAGERFRLRLVNTANARIFVPDFQPLKATAIAVDGMYAARPLDATGFELAPGNRLDLDLTISAELRGRTLTVTSQFERRPFPLATIRVSDDAPVATPSFATLAQAQLPDWDKGLERAPDLTYRLGMQHGGGFGMAWTLNGAVYGQDRAAQLPEGEWVKVRYENDSFRLHPMHMHGVFFRVLARNGQPAIEPHWRDTVLVHPRETVDVALVPIDRGNWMLHCHVLEHAESGMMTSFEVTPAPPSK